VVRGGGNWGGYWTQIPEIARRLSEMASLLLLEEGRLVEEEGGEGVRGGRLWGERVRFGCYSEGEVMRECQYITFGK
jgi:hypothetical protein